MKLDGFEELGVDKQRSEIKIPITNVELTLNVRYFVGTGVGYCALLLTDVRGKGLRGFIKAAAAGVFVGRTIFVFLSELEDGKKLITVPALFEKEPEFNGSVDLSGLIVNTYYHGDFKRTEEDVYKEHMKAMEGKKIRNDKDYLCESILELPEKGLQILRAYR